MTSDGVEVWRGKVEPWEIDQMGHLNVRFYVARATESLTSFAAHLGMERAFYADARSTLMVREHHIRFQREARVSAPLVMTAGVLEMGETDARLLFVLRHAMSGEVCASFNTLVSHVTADEGRPFLWPSATLARTPGLTLALPPFAVPRSIDLAPFETMADAQTAERLSLMHIATGAFAARDCDVFGRMEAQHFMARIASGSSTEGQSLRVAVAEHARPKPERVGNAAVEYRLVYLAWPRAGDRFEIRTGVSDVSAGGRGLIHWMLDPTTGKPWGVAKAFLVALDLDARRMLRVPEAAQAQLRQDLIKGLGL